MSNLSKRLPRRLEPLDSDVSPAATPPGTRRHVEPSLTWEIRPTSGKVPYYFDLSDLAVETEGQRGRPRLTKQFAEILRPHSEGRPKTSMIFIKSALRNLWRFLSTIEGAVLIDDVTDLDDTVGARYRASLVATSLSASWAKKTINLVRMCVLRSTRKVDPKANVLWPSIRDDRGTVHRDVNPSIVKPLYTALKFAFRETGDRLDGRLDIPASAIAIDGDTSNLRSVANEKLLTAASAYVERSSDLVLPKRALIIEEFGLSGPGVKQALDRALRRIVPSFRDTAAAYFLVLMHTGWNPETVQNIDITADQNWCDARLDGAELASVAIYAFKGRVGKEQVAFSLADASCHPYQVIRTQIRRTQKLRSCLQQRIDVLKESEESESGARNTIIVLQRMIKSPWLFMTANVAGAGGRVQYLQGVGALNDYLREMGQSALEWARSRHQADADALKSLLSITSSDLRDAYAAFVYKETSYNDLAVKHALGHRSLSSTRHYLRQRGQIAQRFAEFTAFLEVMWDEIAKYQAVDPTILYLRTRFSEVSREQRDRLLDHRQRTRMGFGCLDPLDPPIEFARGAAGQPCTVHRCTLCRHGVVFADSLEPIAVRMAELIYIRGNMAQQRFNESSFKLEWVAIDALVDNVFQSRRLEFESLKDRHLDRLREGRVYLFDDYLDHSIAMMPS